MLGSASWSVKPVPSGRVGSTPTLPTNIVYVDQINLYILYEKNNKYF